MYGVQRRVGERGLGERRGEGYGKPNGQTNEKHCFSLNNTVFHVKTLFFI